MTDRIVVVAPLHREPQTRGGGLTAVGAVHLIKRYFDNLFKKQNTTTSALNRVKTFRSYAMLSTFGNINTTVIIMKCERIILIGVKTENYTS